MPVFLSEVESATTNYLKKLTANFSTISFNDLCKLREICCKFAFDTVARCLTKKKKIGIAKQFFLNNIFYTDF